VSTSKQKVIRTNGKNIRPALSPEAEEQKMISLAVDLAKRQLIDGTASSQVITHYLQLGSSKKKLEMEKMEIEKQLLEAKTKSYQSGENVEKLYNEAIKAFTSYSGTMDKDYE